MFNILIANGKAKPIEDLVTVQENAYIWSHIDGDLEQIREQLLAHELDGQTIDSLCEAHTRPRLFFNSLGQCVAMLRVLSQQADDLELSSIRVFMSEQKLITISLINSHLVEEIRQSIAGQFRLIKSPEQLFWHVFQSATDGVSSSVIDIDDALGTLEDTWEEGGQIDTNMMHQLRRSATKIKRFLAPQHDVALKVITNIDEVYESVEDAKHYTEKWKNTSNGLKRDLESLTASIERLSILHESIDHQKQDVTNQTMYVLSIVATFFLPMTFVASLLGMNVKGIPYEQHPHAFLGVCGIMLVLIVVQVVLFKRWKWIK